MLTPLAPPPPPEGDSGGGGSGARVPSAGGSEPQPPHRSITEFTSFETLAFGDGTSSGGGGKRGRDGEEASGGGGGDGASGSGGGGGEAAAAFRHLLVQRDAAGREFVVVHAVCLDCLEERIGGDEGGDGEGSGAGGEGGGSGEDGGSGEGGGWRPLSWAASQAFLEALLTPAARPPHLQVISWSAGDVVLWDNLRTQHSVTPTDAYAVAGRRRLMTRTAVPPGSRVLE